MYKFLPYITSIIITLSVLICSLKYLSLKKLEEKRLIDEDFNQVLENLSGRILDNGMIRVEITSLIGNIYKLLEFPQHKKISLSVLKYMRNINIQTDPISLNYIAQAIDEVTRELSRGR